jgi:hypothetical protein
MNDFEKYLQDHQLAALTVSVTARVRYLTVYNATKGNPIKPRHAEMIRQTVHRLTGVPYGGCFTVHIDQHATLPIKKTLIKP